MSEQQQKDTQSNQLLSVEKITKRRLVNLKRQYLVPENGLYSWRYPHPTLEKQIEEFEQRNKGILHYFPVVLEKHHPKIKLQQINGKLTIFYNGRQVDQDFQLPISARHQIIDQLEKTINLKGSLNISRGAEHKKVKNALKQ